MSALSSRQRTMPSIAIERRQGSGPIVTLVPCEGTEVVLTMPEGVYVFEEDASRGLEGNGHSLTIHQDGTLEYDSQTAEYHLQLPRAMADELYAAFEGRAGQGLDAAIEVEGEEDPTNVGGRKRRSRVKKQTRRTKGRRRNTVRK